MITKKTLLFLIIIFVSLFAIYYHFNSFNQIYTDKIYPHIYLDNVNIGGKTKNELLKQTNLKNRVLHNVIISVIYEESPIATYSATSINLHTNASEIINNAYLIGRSPDLKLKISQQIMALLGLKKYSFTTDISYDKSPFYELINISEEKYNKPAKNALFKFENDRVSSFREEERGLKILSYPFYNDLENVIQNLKQKPVNSFVILKSEIIQPEITLAQANQYGIEEKIGEGQSDFTHSAQERIYNLTLASSKFNGVLIPKDKELSFNNTVGDISSLTGYKQAYIIKNGRTILGDGGGVCQVSTTLFRTALNTGLIIIERQAHAYRVSYYENDSQPGFDATVFSPTADLKIKNNTPAAILIQTEIDSNNNILRFRFYGKKDNRKINISKAIIYDQQPPLPAKYQDDPNLKKGVVRQVDFPAWGAKAKFDYKVSIDNQSVFEKTFFSIYRPWQAVYLVGTAD